MSGDTTISGALTPRTLRSAAAAIIIGLALIPLFVDLVGGRDDVQARFKRTVESDPDLRQRIIEANPRTWKEVLAHLPGRRIEGAHLAVDTKRHWIYAALSAVGFLVLAVVLFPGGRSGPLWPVLVAAFTGTVGVALLLIFQVLAAWSQEVVTANPVMLIVKMIGHSYRAAFDPNTGFMMSLAGFTFGVGLCEELLKSLPVFWHFRRKAAMDWRGALLWGIASGVGFGVAEGIFYSADFYNGLYGGTTYMVRFISCVALHSVWTAAVALSIWEDQESIFQADSWLEVAGTLPGILFIPMLLHALYDTFLKRGLESLAMLVALASVAWLVRRLAVAREKERLDPAVA